MNIQGTTPALFAPVQAQSMATGIAKPMASSDTSSTGETNGLSAGNLQSTFLNLLVTELQNQDPTQPVSPTEMVGQMVSLNQLDQLISINQILGSLTGVSTGTAASSAATHGATASGSTASAAADQRTAQAQASQAPVSTSNLALAQAEAAAASQNLNPVLYPANLMNLYGNVGANSNLSINGGR